jgi:3-hydroxyisobutyrate dehydrogenase-like beta-hydroxyacid dehydrogenase
MSSRRVTASPCTTAPPGKAEALVQQGATAAGSVAEASNAEVVFTMLADDRAVEEPQPHSFS